MNPDLVICHFGSGRKFHNRTDNQQRPRMGTRRGERHSERRSPDNRDRLHLHTHKERQVHSRELSRRPENRLRQTYP